MHDPETLAFEIRGLDIWHVDPTGDHGDPCATGPRWRWHVHHWRIVSPPLRALRRRLLTRCAWCGGRHRRNDPVNHAHMGTPPGRWWRGAPGRYHGDCLTIQKAANATRQNEEK